MIEIPRLYFGYIGNAKERVPKLASFLLVTLFPQLPMVCYLSFLQEHTFPFDAALGLIMLSFLACELFFGCYTIRNLMRRQTKEFYRDQYLKSYRNCHTELE